MRVLTTICCRSMSSHIRTHHTTAIEILSIVLISINHRRNRSIVPTQNGCRRIESIKLVFLCFCLISREVVVRNGSKATTATLRCSSLIGIAEYAISNTDLVVIKPLGDFACCGVISNSTSSILNGSAFFWFHQEGAHNHGVKFHIIICHFFLIFR